MATHLGRAGIPELHRDMYNPCPQCGAGVVDYEWACERDYVPHTYHIFCPDCEFAVTLPVSDANPYNTFLSMAGGWNVAVAAHTKAALAKPVVATGRLGPGKPITTRKTNAVEVFADKRLTALDKREAELVKREQHVERMEAELDERWEAYRTKETTWIDTEVRRRIAPFKQALSDTFDAELAAAVARIVDERLGAAALIRRSRKRRRITVCECGQTHQPKEEDIYE